MYFDKVYYDENGNISEIQIICNKCGKFISVKYEKDVFIKVNNEFCILQNNHIVCDCGNHCLDGLLQPKPLYAISPSSSQSHTFNIPKCPTCSSTKIERITGTQRFITTGLFGLASSDIGKTMRCNNCGYKW